MSSRLVRAARRGTHGLPPEARNHMAKPAAFGTEEASTDLVDNALAQSTHVGVPPVLRKR